MRNGLRIDDLLWEFMANYPQNIIVEWKILKKCVHLYFKGFYDDNAQEHYQFNKIFLKGFVLDEK